MSDASGQTLALAETIRQIAAAGNFIILSMEDTYLFPGVLGGFVTSGKQQGNTAGSMALSCLSGDDLDRIEAVRVDAGTCRMFKKAEVARPGVLERLTRTIGKARGVVGLVLGSPKTWSAAEEG